MAENAAEVLAAIARARASPLTRVLGAPGNLQRLVARAVDAPKSPALIQVPLALECSFLHPLRPMCPAQPPSAQFSELDELVRLYCMAKALLKHPLITRGEASGMNSLALLQALNICIALVERRRLWEAAHESGAANLPNELDRLLELQAVETLAPHASDLLYHLSNEQSEGVQASAVPLSASGTKTLTAALRCRVHAYYVVDGTNAGGNLLC